MLTLPGLSVIIDAIKESRKIFQRMNSYAIYRIAETIRVLFFITLAILIFNFYPLTARMIVMLALLNDIPIMMIAYDNAKVNMQPERWNMREVLSIATFLGFIGVAFSFGLFLMAKLVYHLSPETIQTLMFLKLAAGGHLTIYLTRTGRGPVLGQTLSFLAPDRGHRSYPGRRHLIRRLRGLDEPLGWTKALLVLAYIIAAFIITNFLKERLFRWL